MSQGNLSAMADKFTAAVCTAHTTSGNPCRNPAIRGGRVCRHHGGSAPQVKAAARRRLLEAATLNIPKACGDPGCHRQYWDEANVAWTDNL